MVKSGRYEIMASGFFPLIGIAPTIQYNDFFQSKASPRLMSSEPHRVTTQYFHSISKMYTDAKKQEK